MARPQDEAMTTPQRKQEDAASTRSILRRLAEGKAEEVLRDVDPEALKRAAAEALAAIDHPPPETREQRITRIREKHPRAFEPWSEDEDAHLLRRFDEGTQPADLAREMHRPPNAIRLRLEKWLGPSWRTRGAGPSADEV
jgi:hypothetical protein